VWQMACRLEEIPQAYDFVEYEILDQSVIVVRTDELGVTAFQNTCRHRGVKVVEGSGTCETGFTCDPTSANCVVNDNTIRIEAIEGSDFLGQAFLCQDPYTSDILHVGMYDSALSILAWFQNHPGSPIGLSPITGAPEPAAQVACNVLVIRSPANNVVQQIVSLSNGVELNFGGGQGQGRVTDIVLFDINLIQSF